ncbi:MAG TPA: site-specific integrase [Blastocatellia bacterium]|nr:site-specific integrase [Blastocatellia bacterium]
MKNINSNKAGDKEIKFEDFIDSEYLPEKKTYNPDTYAHYELMAEVFSAHFKGRFIHEVTAGDIRAFRQERANSKTRTGTDRAIGTLNREIRQLSGVFQLAVENGYIKNNFARVVKNIPVDNVREKVLEPEEEEKLFAALAGDRAKFKPIAQLALYTGLRLSEVVELTWEQVDLLSEKPKLTIKSKGRGRKKKKRSIPLIGAPFKLLQDLRADCDGKGRVFTGRGISPTNVCHRFSVICDEVGLPDVTMHTLRHTFCTRVVDNGGNPAHAQQVLGHSSLATTQRYLHPGEKAVRESMKKQDDREAKKTASRPNPDAIEDTNPDSAK